ncbi:efflux transporter outer membrane subunit [Aggregatibacter actinomycetemcomitans]|uniref:efflux transporter outer membrane subunit n=1 Tax=Aggregatibacter actinomycetemcomitans TaxID=714 RepID=UPI00023FF70D|nr:TolC family protein [Aggregatibacter actinomycetemcomitans]EHK91207.1 TolC protein [Aggregatibacter actinomycetemcomitans RhAA1]KNE78236.1 membrane protein [Aggregatibacter actinomycetemcomitans RhAA1]
MANKFAFKFTFIAAFITLTACTTSVDLSSKVAMPAQFEKTSNEATAKNAMEITRWWQNWRDPQLTRLIELGLQNNLDIEIAKARLQEAQANSQYTQADLGPKVGVQGSAGMIHSHVENPLTQRTNDRSGNVQYAGITASWELDFFGKKRSDRDAAQVAALAAQQQVYAAQMLVAGQIAESYANIAALRKQNVLLQQNEKHLLQLKGYAQGRFRAGQANANDVLQVESRISTVQAQQATVNAQIAGNERAIAILIGKPPQGFHLTKSAVDFLGVLPPAPNGVMPGDVLERRPDLRAYRAQVQALAAKLASAKADLYPHFEIQFLGQTGRIDINTDIPDLKGWGNLLSLDISLPIFTNGRIQANIDAADARLKAALLQYDKGLLQALADVDNSYQAQAALNRQTQLLKTAYQQAQKQANNAEKLFNYGEKTLDNALTARLTALDYQNQLIQSRLAGAKNLINLYKALGGGWSE